MLELLRDELAETLNGEAKELFLGLVEGFHEKKEKWSESASKAMYKPTSEFPRETLEAMVLYTSAWCESRK